MKAALELVGLEGYGVLRRACPVGRSSGQLWRGLALNREILIFDEATSMLDPKGRREVLAEMKSCAIVEKQLL